MKKLNAAFKVSFVFLSLSGLMIFPACKKSESAGGNKKEMRATAALDQPAPNFTLKNLAGQSVSLSDFQGQVVLLDFWATWCPPCRMSTPVVARIHQKFAGQKFTALGVSLDEDEKAVAPYVQKENIPYPILLGGNSPVGASYRIEAIPGFFIVDKTGKIRKHYEGFSPSLEKEWEDVIAQLLKE